jgi:hypothetical protein
MYSYETVTEALNDLKTRGFAADFNIQSNAIECRELNLQLNPADFEIVEFYRFEGDSNPGDEEVVYAIESKEGLKGVLVDAFGTYSDGLSSEILEKLRIGR